MKNKSTWKWIIGALVLAVVVFGALWYNSSAKRIVKPIIDETEAIAP